MGVNLIEMQVYEPELNGLKIDVYKMIPQWYSLNWIYYVNESKWIEYDSIWNGIWLQWKLNLGDYLWNDS